jgi:hypothetical protein
MEPHLNYSADFREIPDFLEKNEQGKKYAGKRNSNRNPCSLPYLFGQETDYSLITYFFCSLYYKEHITGILCCLEGRKCKSFEFYSLCQ